MKRMYRIVDYWQTTPADYRFYGPDESDCMGRAAMIYPNNVLGVLRTEYPSTPVQLHIHTASEPLDP
jgi:hypothetical protein